MDSNLRRVIGGIPYRAALAGGWIDQPFVSRLNPTPPGSMVVVGLEPDFYWMDRCGMGTSTRRVALRLWGKKSRPESLLPWFGSCTTLKTTGQSRPIRLAGYGRVSFTPASIASIMMRRWRAAISPPMSNRTTIRRWPPGWKIACMFYRSTNARWVIPRWESKTSTLNGCAVWGKPARIVSTPSSAWICAPWALLQRMYALLGDAPAPNCPPSLLTVDLVGLMHYYQSRYAGAMYSGCGGGYLYVISDEPVPGALKVHVRVR